MYITPSSTIRILKNVRLDNTYANTIHFNSSTEQAAYFQGLQKYALNNYTYLRKENAIRVEIRTDNLYDCNYLMFQNSAFGTKWFYAFITNVEYVNNETSSITYEIDVMQTWYFDYTVNPSFVEREHSATDVPGDNLVPDNLEMGDYVSDDFDGSGHMGNYSIVCAATFDMEYNDAVGKEYAGVYSGLAYSIYTNPDDFSEWLDGAVAKGKSDGIVSIFLMPTDFAIGYSTSAPKSYDVTKTKNLTTIGGYTPKNKKLFTYPYNFLYVTNLSGSSAEFHYELFSSDSCEFGMTGDTSCNPQVILYPKNYKGVPANYNEKLVMDGFPQCAYGTDAFKAWLAQTGASSAISMTAGLAGLGLASGALGVMSSLGSIGSVVAQAYQHEVMPPQAKGSQANTTMVAARIKDYAFMHVHVQEQFARIIDDYWNMYGYPVHRVKVPNVSNRFHWYYVKTINVSITGSIPVDDMAKIKSIYDNGVTFWRNGGEVGNYALDNSIGTNGLNGGETNG